MSGKSRAGWAVRRWDPSNKGCSTFGETGGKTWGDYFACCPEGTSAQGPFDNENKWCDGPNHAPGNSTSEPQCASSKWSLYTVDNWWWCCDDESQDDSGYFYINTSDWNFGCASASWIKNSTKPIRTADSHFNPPGATNKSSISKGTIAGAVIGGVCGAIVLAVVIWFLHRRRRRSRTVEFEGDPATPKNTAWELGSQYKCIPSELGDTRRGASEVDGSYDRKEAPGNTQPPREVAGDTPKERKPFELP